MNPRTFLLRLFTGLTCALVLSFTGPARAAEPPMTDVNITDAVEEELIQSPAVPAYKISVATAEGIVTLSGTVSDLLARDRATRLAETVKGVRGVINEIEVDPLVTLTDLEIEEGIEDALVQNVATESYEVSVAVVGGIATLSGTVQSHQERQLAETVAKGVRGVTGVVNNISVVYQTERTDAEIQADIEEALRWDALVDAGLIDVDVTDHKVTLTGVVGSAAEKSRAISDAYVLGTYSVDASGLDVARWARDPDLRGEAYAAVTDAGIQDAVEDAMLYDPEVNSLRVTTEVDDGVVTLRGTVDSLRARQAAAEDARTVMGVRRVKNRLRVAPVTAVSDRRIENRVEDALERDPVVDRYEIVVSVINGVTYLNGSVESYYEKAQARDVASRVNGVIAVENNLEVTDTYEPLVYEPYEGDFLYDPYPYDYGWYDYQPGYTLTSDAEIREDIQSELFWSPFVDSDQVNVSVEDGAATLTGTVDTWLERMDAEENAYEGGATWVRNRLDVE